MNLRDLAASDHAAIVSDVAAGFAIPIVVTDPAGVTLAMGALTSDVGEVVDPQTGLVMDGQRVMVHLLVAPLLAAGMGEPRAIADGTGKPWLVRFANVYGVARTFKIVTVAPENVLGAVKCGLEAWK